MRRTAAAALLVLAATLAVTARQPVTCDLLVAGGRVVDGTGSPWFAADVCVIGDRIAAVGRLDGATARRRIDATGLVVAPGFLDILGQSEYWVLRDSRVASKVMQGITTELTGEASFTSVGHPGARTLHPFAAMFDREGVPAAPTWPAISMCSIAGRRRSTSARSSAPAGCARWWSAATIAPRRRRSWPVWRRWSPRRWRPARSAWPPRCSTCPTGSPAPRNSWRWLAWPGVTAAATSRTSGPRPTPSTTASTRCSASPARPACRRPSTT